jgi:hypothetical protein
LKPVSYITVYLAFAGAAAYAALAVWRLSIGDYSMVAQDVATALYLVLLAVLGHRIRLQQFDTDEGSSTSSDAPLVTPLPDGGWLVHFNGSRLDRIGDDYVTLTDKHGHDEEEGSPQA